MSKKLPELVQDYISQENLDRTEGRVGVENLCKLVRALGYYDTLYFGQFPGGSYGDLIEFLKDNSGAIEAIIEWISYRNVSEWEDNLIGNLQEDDIEDDLEDDSI